MSNINNGLVDGVRRIGAKVRELTIDGGIPAAPLGLRIRGANTSGPPTTGTWKTGDITTDRAGSVWMCTTAGTPGTWTQTGRPPQVDWISVKNPAYGAKVDGQRITNAAMTSGSPTLTSSSGLFKGSDTGKLVYVLGAGNASGDARSTPLTATIVAVSSSTSVTLSANAAATVSGMDAYWGTDDTAAIQAAWNAGGVVYHPFGYSLTSSPLTMNSNFRVTGASVQGANGQSDIKGSVIVNGSTAIISDNFTTRNGIVIDHMTFLGLNGHIITALHVAASSIFQTRFIINHENYSIWDHDGSQSNAQSFGNTFKDIYLVVRGATRTVPAWTYYSAADETISGCLFENINVNNADGDSSEYIFKVTSSTSASGAKQSHLTWRNCQFGEPCGGAIYLGGIQTSTIFKCSVDNYSGLHPAVNSPYFITSVGGSNTNTSRGISIIDCLRSTVQITGAGTTWWDIELDPSAPVALQDMTIVNYNLAATTGYTPYINVGSASNVTIIGGAANTVYYNEAPDTLVIGNGTVTAGGAAVASIYGLMFGDGSDGAVTLDGSTGYASFSSLNSGTKTYTLTRDVCATSLTVNSTVTLLPNGFRIFCTGAFSNAGVVDNSGAAASGSTGGVGGSTGCVLAQTISGATGTSGNGAQGTAAGTGYGVGTSGGGGAGTSGKTAGGSRSANGGTGPYRNPSFLLTGSGAWAGAVKAASGAGGAGSGGGDGTNTGGGGGAGGAIVAVFAHSAVNTGTISANGGNGGTPSAGNCGGGGGGGGGIIAVYTLSAWTAGTTSVLGGSAGTASGTGAANGTAGTSGSVINIVVT